MIDTGAACFFGDDPFSARTEDITGDGIPDLVITNGCEERDPLAGYTHWNVYRGNGAGFDSVAMVWELPPGFLMYGMDDLDVSHSDGCVFGGIFSASTFDIDGNGAPDLVVTDSCDDGIIGTVEWQVYLNNGSSFDAEPIAWDLPRDARGLRQAVAATIGLKVDGNLIAPLTALGDGVLAIDNWEQIADECREIPGDWLARTEVRFVVTSRRSTGVPGEQLLPLEPFAVNEVEEVTRDDIGVRLFVERAGAILPDYSPDDEDIAAIGRVVRAVDGLPLAIELAAARMRVLRPGAIADRLDTGTRPRTTTLGVKRRRG